MKRTVISVNPDYHRALRIYAAKKGMSMYDAVRYLLGPMLKNELKAIRSNDRRK